MHVVRISHTFSYKSKLKTGHQKTCFSQVAQAFKVLDHPKGTQLTMEAKARIA